MLLVTCFQGGKTIRGICEASGASSLDIDDSGSLQITAATKEAAEAAKTIVLLLTDDVQPGTIVR